MEKTTEIKTNGQTEPLSPTIKVVDQAKGDGVIVAKAKRAAKLHGQALADQPEALRTKAMVKAASRVIFAALAEEKGR